MAEDHPVTELRRLLVEEFSTDLPAGVHPVPEWCRDPQFFPGATGLLAEKSWADVEPGSAGVAQACLPPPRRGVLVLGNYQATLASYRRVLDGTIGGFPTTWRALRRLMAGIAPTEVFLTNAYIGLPDLSNDRAPFPTTPSFTARCERLLTREIELFAPRVVVCLGQNAARMLAAVADRLSVWRPWPGYKALSSRNHEVMPGCRVSGVKFTAVAVQHPSAVISTVERQRHADLISHAASFNTE